MSDVRSELLRIGEFADRLGVDPRQVHRWVASGLIKRDDSGLFDAAQLAADFRKPTRATLAKRGRTSPGVRPKTSDTVRSGKSDNPVAARAGRRPTETPAQAAERLVNEHGSMPLAQALAMKETYLARLKKLEHDQKVGLVVPIAQVTAAVGAEWATVRRRLLALPSETAPLLLRCRTAPEIQTALYEAVHQALSDLTSDEADAIAPDTQARP